MKSDIKKIEKIKKNIEGNFADIRESFSSKLSKIAHLLEDIDVIQNRINSKEENNKHKGKIKKNKMIPVIKKPKKIKVVRQKKEKSK